MMLAWWLWIAASSPVQDLEEVDRQLVATEEALNRAQQERDTLLLETSRRQSELAQARLRRAEIMVVYRARIRALARMPTGARMVVLGLASSMRDFLRASKLLRRIAAADRRIATRRQAEEARIARLEAEAVEKETAALQLERVLRTKRDALAQIRTQRRSTVQSINTNPAAQREWKSGRQQAEHEVSGWIDQKSEARSIAQDFLTLRGQLPWPTSGRIVTRFGEVTEQRFNTRLKHPGLDFSAAAGTPANAVAPGHVVFAEWMRAYGQLVIIDHGGGFHTLYAHLARLDVHKGMSIAAGHRLGTVGDTGSLRGTRLYFELRHNGLAQDPETWLRHE